MEDETKKASELFGRKIEPPTQHFGRNRVDSIGGKWRVSTDREGTGKKWLKVADFDDRDEAVEAAHTEFDDDYERSYGPLEDPDEDEDEEPRDFSKLTDDEVRNLYRDAHPDYEASLANKARRELVKRGLMPDLKEPGDDPKDIPWWRRF